MCPVQIHTPLAEKVFFLIGSALSPFALCLCRAMEVTLHSQKLQDTSRPSNPNLYRLGLRDGPQPGFTFLAGWCGVVRRDTAEEDNGDFTAGKIHADSEAPDRL